MTDPPETYTGWILQQTFSLTEERQESLPNDVSAHSEMASLSVTLQRVFRSETHGGINTCLIHTGRWVELSLRSDIIHRKWRHIRLQRLLHAESPEPVLSPGPS